MISENQPSGKSAWRRLEDQADARAGPACYDRPLLTIKRTCGDGSGTPPFDPEAHVFFR